MRDVVGLSRSRLGRYLAGPALLAAALLMACSLMLLPRQAGAQPAPEDPPPSADSLTTVAGQATVGTGVIGESFLDIYVRTGGAAVRLIGSRVRKPVAAGDSVWARGRLQVRGQVRVLEVQEYEVFPAPGAQPLERRPRHQGNEYPLGEGGEDLSSLRGRVVRLGGYAAQAGHDHGGPFLTLQTAGGPLLVRAAPDAALPPSTFRVRPHAYVQAAGVVIPPVRPDGPHRLLVRAEQDVAAAWIAPAAFLWAVGAAAVALLALLAAFVSVRHVRRTCGGRYEAHFEQAVGAALITRPDWQVEQLNEAAAHLLRDAPSHLRRKNLRRLLHAPGQEAPALPERLEDEDDDLSVDASVAGRDAEGVLHVRATLITIDGEQRYSVSLHDVTTRNWESTLFKAFHRQTLRDLPIEVAVLSPEGTYLYTNPRIAQAASIAGRLVGQTDFDYVRTAGLKPEVALRRRAHRRKALQLSERVRFEERVAAPDGAVQYYDRFYTPIFDKEGKPYAVVFYGIETTHAKRQQTQAEAAQEEVQRFARLRESFLENMSHEFRTPLTGILGAAEVLAAEAPEEQREFARIVRRNGERLMSTLDAMMDLIGMENGPEEMRPQIVDLFEEAKRAAGEAAPQAGKKDLYLHLEASQPDVLVRVDPFFLRRVLHSLIGNAVKFTERGGVAVDVFQDAHRACLRVMDTGVGMEEQYIPYLFDAFEQESTGIGRSFEGVGIGLSLAKRLLDRMGGAITVDSAKGEGSVFTVSFPAALPPAEDGAPPRALVAEPDAQQQRLLRHLLAPRLRADLAGSAEEVLRRLAEQPYDVVILSADLLGPGNGEDDLVGRMRDVLTESQPVPALVGLDAATGPEKARPEKAQRERSGIRHWVSKPARREALLQAVAEALAPAGEARAADEEAHAQTTAS